MKNYIAAIACLGLLISAAAVAQAAENWHEDAFFGLHYDLHPGATDTELGRECTHEHIRAMLEKADPDFVQYDCKGPSRLYRLSDESGIPFAGHCQGRP